MGDSKIQTEFLESQRRLRLLEGRLPGAIQKGMRVALITSAQAHRGGCNPAFPHSDGHCGSARAGLRPQTRERAGHGGGEGGGASRGRVERGVASHGVRAGGRGRRGPRSQVPQYLSRRGAVTHALGLLRPEGILCLYFVFC